jgi:hypothetical protein
MTVGALVLMALDRSSISSGPFSLAGYVRLNRIEQVVLDSINTTRQRWDAVEVFYSGTRDSNIANLISATSTQDNQTNFHFVITNATEGADGQILYTGKWEQQQDCLSSEWCRNQGRVIRICIVADGVITLPTDAQRKRTDALVTLFRNQFGVAPEKINYPAGWQL